MVEKAIRSLLHSFDEPNNGECKELIKTREIERPRSRRCGPTRVARPSAALAACTRKRR